MQRRGPARREARSCAPVPATSTIRATARRAAAIVSVGSMRGASAGAAEDLAAPRPTRRRAAPAGPDRLAARSTSRRSSEGPGAAARPATCERSSSCASVGGGASSCVPDPRLEPRRTVARLAHCGCDLRPSTHAGCDLTAAADRLTGAHPQICCTRGSRRSSTHHSGAPSSRERCGRRAHRVEDRGAQARRLELAQPGRGRAAGRRDRGAQRLRAVAALGEQRGRAEQRLHHELLRHVAGEPDEHAGFDHRLGDEEHVRRARSPTTR